MFYDRSGIKVKLLSVPSESDFRGVAASLSGHYGVGGDEGTSPLTVFEAMKSELEKPTFAMTNFEPFASTCSHSYWGRIFARKF